MRRSYFEIKWKFYLIFDLNNTYKLMLWLIYIRFGKQIVYIRRRDRLELEKKSFTRVNPTVEVRYSNFKIRSNEFLGFI